MPKAHSYEQKRCNTSNAEQISKTTIGTDSSLFKMLTDTLSLFLFPEKQARRTEKLLSAKRHHGLWLMAYG